MSVNIGIFDKEADVVEAIRLLREAGVDHGELRVIVKNAEAAPMIASTTDVPVEELVGLQDAAGSQTGHTTAMPMSNLGHGTTAYTTGMVVGGLNLDGEDDGSDRLLRVVGIPDHASERCGEAVEAGRFLLCTEADEDTNTDLILRHAGAADVLH